MQCTGNWSGGAGATGGAVGAQAIPGIIQEATSGDRCYNCNEMGHWA